MPSAGNYYEYHQDSRSLEQRGIDAMRERRRDRKQLRKARKRAKG